jgi:plastocyanin
MVKSRMRFTVLGILVLCLFGAPCGILAQGVDVSVKVEVQPDSSNRDTSKASTDSNGVVLWLSPLQPNAFMRQAPHQNTYRLIQKGKQFTPHLLVVPTGSSVEFPNLDPFYHNVFSLFNGKRFDLGLYEAGTSKIVRFDREGASYIFCNIHPEMGAVVLSLSTPYYAMASAQGLVTIHNVPPGSYRLSLWSENGLPASLNAASRTIQVASADMNLGTIEIRATRSPMMQHKNKFGEEYPPDMNRDY